MKNPVRLPLLTALFLMLSPGIASIKAAQHEHGAGVSQPDQVSPIEQTRAMKVGKKGDIQFRSDTQVGDLTLKPGRYQIQHRVEGADHFFHFTEVTKANVYGSDRGGIPKAHPGEAKCNLEPLEKKVSRTTVYTKQEDGSNRVTRIEVAGENVAHVF